MKRVSKSPPSRRAAAKPKAATPRYYSRAVSKALDALSLIARQAEPAPLHAIAAELELTKASTMRLLHTLEAKGLLRGTADARYTLAAGQWDVIASGLLGRLLQAAAGPMRELNNELRETVTLAALFQNHSEVAAVLESPELMRMGNTVGRILPPHASSLGKAIAAFQDEAVRKQLVRSYGLHAFTPATITKERDLETEYATILRRGYAVDREETVPDGCCFGAPIFDAAGRAVAALSCSLPKFRLESRGGESGVVTLLRRAAETITRELGGK